MMYDQETIPDEVRDQAHYAMLAARWAVVSVGVLILVKSYAYYLSGAVSLLGTLIDSFSDAGISLIMLMALKHSLKPADEEHRYGHGKAEGLAALFQVAFLTGAAVFLTLESLQRLAEPREVSHHLLGMGVAGFSVLLTLVLVGVQNYAIQRSSSLIVAADKRHYTSDVLLNGGVILALFIHMQGGPVWVDSVFGLGVAGYLVFTAVMTARDAADMLMDRELEEPLRQKIEDIVTQHPRIYGMHDLRTRSIGMMIHISFDVEIDPEISLREAHTITREVEQALLAEFPNADIIIHKDPRGDIYDARHRVQGIHH